MFKLVCVWLGVFDNQSIPFLGGSFLGYIHHLWVFWFFLDSGGFEKIQLLSRQTQLLRVYLDITLPRWVLSICHCGPLPVCHDVPIHQHISGTEARPETWTSFGGTGANQTSLADHSPCPCFLHVVLVTNVHPWNRIAYSSWSKPHGHWKAILFPS